MEPEMHSIFWEIAKYGLSFIVIPFAVWVVTSHIKIKGEINSVKEDTLKFKEEVAKSYAAKQDVTALATQIDNKFSSMQNAVTQRIDTMQSSLATMIASISFKGKD